MRKGHSVLALTFFATVFISVVATQNGELSHLATGLINCQPTDLSGSSPTFTVSLSRAGFDAATPAHALGTFFFDSALAGFEATSGQTFYSLIVAGCQFKNTNSLMQIQYKFTNRGAKVMATTWLKIRMSYLVISPTFDGSYTNIWASRAELDPSRSPVVNLPIDPVGNEFSLNGGSPKDCEIFISPLLQVDLSGCEPIAAENQYRGGKPIIHAYISGFSFNASSSQDMNISVLKGNKSADQNSDSDGWSIFYSSMTPNGPEVTIPYLPSQLVWVQVSFLFVRTDVYSRDYPFNSQLQYSSSHIFTPVNRFNTPIQLTKTAQCNQNYYRLPDNTHSFYGLSAFNLNTLSSNNLVSVFVSLDKDFISVNTDGSGLSSVIVSGDIFIKNIDKLCDAKVNGKQLTPNPNPIIKAFPPNDKSTAVEVTSQYTSSQLCSNSHSVVYEFTSPADRGRESSVSASFKYSGLTVGKSARLELRYFQNQVQQSLINGNNYTVCATVNGVSFANFKWQYQKKAALLLSSSAFRALTIDSSEINIIITVTFQTNAKNSQKLYVLLAVSEYSSVYDPDNDCCSNSCPANTGLDAAIVPIVCVKCDSSAGLVYNLELGSCGCKPGSYLNPTSNQCFPCGNTYCLTCNPNKPTQCLSCPTGTILNNGTCSCKDNQYLSSSGCVTCPSACQTCIGPNGLCLTCSKNRKYSTDGCICASGFVDQGTGDCGLCDTRCENCDTSGKCTSCKSSDNRELVNGACVCKKKSYQVSTPILQCQLCADVCQTCSQSSSNCTSCDSALNRVLSGNDCVCSSGYSSSNSSLQCVQDSCNSDPFCTQCVNTSSTQRICIQCATAFNRIIDLNSYRCVCKNGFFDDGKKNCVPCASGCQLCSSYFNCTSCATLATYVGDGTCRCPVGTYFTISTDSVRFCTNCGPLCQQCIDSDNCLLCKGLAKLNKGVCGCSTSTFLNESASECQSCSSGCLNCSNSSNCINCQAGLFMYAGRCLQSCAIGYTASNNICVPCTPNCVICKNTQECNTCASNFSLFNGQCITSCPSGTVNQLTNNISICTPCSSPCKNCEQTPFLCTSCADSSLFLLVVASDSRTCVSVCPLGTVPQDQKCVPCDESCFACASSPSNCIQCNSTLILYNGQCVLTCPGIISNNTYGTVCVDTCPDGFFNSSQSTCSPCNSQCRTCFGTAINCTDCAYGVLADYGVCVSNCKENQYISGGACLNCAPQCAKCFKTADNCVKCKNGLVKSAGKCIKSCSKNQYYNSTLAVCRNCQRMCASCSNEDQCLTCKDGKLPIKGQCINCSPPCLTCTSSGRCLSCISGSNLFNGACLQKCPNATVPVQGRCSCPIGVLHGDKCVSSCSTGYFSSNGHCLQCDSSCLQCSGQAKQCSKCFFGSSLVNSTCQATSNCAYGQILINQTCTRVCKQGSYFFQFACIYGGCEEGYSPNSFGGCERINKFLCPRDECYLSGNCYQICPSGYYPDYSLKQCQICPRNCLQCTSNNYCFKCAQNYTSLQGQCLLNSCQSGQWAAGDRCVSVCPEGTQPRNNICVPICRSGKYLFNSLCYSVCPTKLNNGYACLQTSPNPNKCHGS